MTIGQCWMQVGKDLGLRIEAPFKLVFEDGITLEFDALVKDFGAPLGMLITTEFEKIEKFDDQLIKMGYGFSTMSHPSEHRVHDSERFKDVLNDWGWSGDPQNAPTWVKEMHEPSEA